MLPIKKFLTRLGTQKSQKQQNDIPTNILKENSGTYYIFSWKHNFLYREFNFLFDLKLVNPTPVFKKKSRTSKINCRPTISILPNIFNIYERCFYHQTQTYSDEILSRYQCGFCKGFNAENYFINIKKHRK